MNEEVKVSELTEASVINDEDLLMTVQNNVNKKAPFSKVLSGVEPTINNKLMLAKYQGGSLDPNTTLEPLILSHHQNAPEGSGGAFYYIKTMFYQEIATTSNRTQIAVGYNKNKIYQRYYAGGTWSAWMLVSNDVEAVQADTGFNTLNVTGTYFYGSVPTGNNKPVTSGLQSGVLEVFRHPTSNMVTQRYTNYDASKIYVRGEYNNTWSAWKTITPS